MDRSTDLSAWYDAHYYRTYQNAPYERSALWLTVFGAMADAIIRDIAPKTVLDAGCAKGFLVESLRDRGVAAEGIDFSEHAIASVREDIRPYCRVASVAQPIEGRYDLAVCCEVLEHLPPREADAAVAHLCAVADDVLFSSTPDGYAEDTHLNVQPPEYWVGLFAKHGFVRDLEFDASTYISPWACRFRRNSDPLHRVASAYERRVWALTREVRALRTRALETAAELAARDEERRARPEFVRLEETIAEQQQHLDALNERVQFMSDHEAELRRMLVDAHTQLLERDQMLQAQAVEPLQRLVEERTEWAQRAVAELEECRKVALERQALVEERTAWAQAAVAELEALRGSKKRGFRG